MLFTPIDRSQWDREEYFSYKKDREEIHGDRAAERPGFKRF